MRLADSIVNRVPLAARTNRMIGSNPPSVYLEKLQKATGIAPESMDAILKSHLIDPDLVRADYFDSFFSARSEALLGRIEAAMGKPIARSLASPSVLGADIQPEEEPEPSELAE